MMERMPGRPSPPFPLPQSRERGERTPSPNPAPKRAGEKNELLASTIPIGEKESRISPLSRLCERRDGGEGKQLRWPATLLLLMFVSVAFANDSAAERGRKALETKNYNPSIWTREAYDKVWKSWEGVTEKPADYDRAFREVYGLHAAPYPNNGLPMGLREGWKLLRKGLSVDCLVCHGGSILGQSYVGLGNTALDLQALFEDFFRADDVKYKSPFTFSHVRGTTEAGGMSIFLLGYRNPDLTLRPSRLDLDLHDDFCEDPPAWWLLHKKKTMYHTGGADARSVRSIMQFMMGSLNSPEMFANAEADFADILAYFKSLRAPKYPFAVDAGLAKTGERLFVENCARCHGTYGENWTYPNKIVAIDEIGTDPKRYYGITEKFGRYYAQSWFAQAEFNGKGPAYPPIPSDGYQAPPLDGIWATAPYFHNGSAPTIWHVLNSKARPKRFTRSYRTDEGDFDKVRLGWKFTEAPPPHPDWPASERRKVYDTSQPGRSNSGHTYGDKLSDAERMAVIEYLKAL
jgi:mono/diheme cytochrome c family protein